MKAIIKRVSGYAITWITVVIAIVALCHIWTFYTLTPWTRDARFAAEIVAIAPDVSGIIADVSVVDNQLVKKNDALFLLDQTRFQNALDIAQADVNYYQSSVNEKQREAARRNRLGSASIAREAIEKANNELQITQFQLAKAIAARDLAKIDLERTQVLAPADGWITNLNVYQGEYIARGTAGIALVKKDSFYVIAYLEETKLPAIQPGYRAEITPLGSDRLLYGTVVSVAAGITNSSATTDHKGVASINANLEWVRLAQRVPVRIQLDKQYANTFPAGTTATVLISANGSNEHARQTIFSRIVKRLREMG